MNSFRTIPDIHHITNSYSRSQARAEPLKPQIISRKKKQNAPHFDIHESAQHTNSGSGAHMLSLTVPFAYRIVYDDDLLLSYFASIYCHREQQSFGGVIPTCDFITGFTYYYVYYKFRLYISMELSLLPFTQYSCETHI